eukprot:5213617-Pyramimonas_sp.AAC.1
MNREEVPSDSSIPKSIVRKSTGRAWFLSVESAASQHIPNTSRESASPAHIVRKSRARARHDNTFRGHIRRELLLL